jgi:pyridoxine kinase
MTGMEYRERHDKAYVQELLSRLNKLGAGISVLTGVSLEEGKTGIMGFDRAAGDYYLYQNRRINGAYHGTGDLFSSTCVGELMRGRDWRDAMRIAADYTAHTIEDTMKNPKKPWYGVDFEATLPDLLRMA